MIGWNTTVAPIVREIIRNDSGGKELSNWFGKEIEEVTIYQLIYMRSGLRDYKDDDLEKNYTVIKDFEIKNPTDYFAVMEHNGSFAFKPGTNYKYSSIGYILLQYVSAVLSGAKSWKDYD